MTLFPLKSSSCLKQLTMYKNYRLSLDRNEKQSLTNNYIQDADALQK